MKCESRIVREYKTKKAEPIWPMRSGHWSDSAIASNGWVLNPDADAYPVCGGDVTITVRAIDEPEWGSSYAKLEVEYVCSRCQYPWVPAHPVIARMLSNAALDLTAIFDTMAALRAVVNEVNTPEAETVKRATDLYLCTPAI